MSGLLQPMLFEAPMAGLYPCSIEEANHLLTLWGHRLGPVHRPFLQQGWLLSHNGVPLSVAVSGSIVSNTVAGFALDEVVELTRLCSAPEALWATRPMLRFWREVCAPAWPRWQVRAAISYSQNTHHRGDIYRFDGWEKLRDDCGRTGGGAFGRPGYSAPAALRGRKTLWIWRYDSASETESTA